MPPRGWLSAPEGWLRAPKNKEPGLGVGAGSHSQDLGVAPLAEAELLQPLLVVQDLQDRLLEHPDVRLQLGQAEGQVHGRDGAMAYGSVSPQGNSPLAHRRWTGVCQRCSAFYMQTEN